MAGLNESDGNDGIVGAADSTSEHFESSSQGETHQGKARQHPETPEVVDGLELPVHAKKVDTYNIMMDLHGKAGDFEKASMTFRDMVKAGVDPDIVTYNTMIHICGRAGRVREAKALFKKISEKGLVPDVASYNTLISMFLRRGEKLKALHYYQRMKTAGIAPNAITFHMLLRHSMISVADIGSSVELGKHISSLMEELSLGVGEPMQDSELAQTIMLNLYKKAGSHLTSSIPCFFLKFYFRVNRLKSLIYHKQLCLGIKEISFVKCRNCCLAMLMIIDRLRTPLDLVDCLEGLHFNSCF